MREKGGGSTRLDDVEVRAGADGSARVRVMPGATVRVIPSTLPSVTGTG
jgi:hypothetical protein